MRRRGVGVCLQVLIIAVCTSGNTLQCPPCDSVTCESLTCPEERQVLDPVCGCCRMCGRLGFGRCGGSDNIPCAPGLVCIYRVGNIFDEERTGMCESSKWRLSPNIWIPYKSDPLVWILNTTTCTCSIRTSPEVLDPSRPNTTVVFYREDIAVQCMEPHLDTPISGHF